MSFLSLSLCTDSGFLNSTSFLKICCLSFCILLQTSSISQPHLFVCHSLCQCLPIAAIIRSGMSRSASAWNCRLLEPAHATSSSQHPSASTSMWLCPMMFLAAFTTISFVVSLFFTHISPYFVQSFIRLLHTYAERRFVVVSVFGPCTLTHSCFYSHNDPKAEIPISPPLWLWHLNSDILSCWPILQSIDN